MGSIPLPALNVQAPQQQDLLQKFSQLQQLQNMRQQSQMQQQEAPARQQILSQQAQLGAAQVQEQQQALKDQAAFRALSADPANKGKTVGELADLLAQKGQISQAGLLGAKKADLETRSSLAKLDGTTLTNQDAAHKQTQELYNNVMNLPDDQLAANWPQIAQQYDAIPGNNKTPLDPNKPLTKQELSHFAPVISMANAYFDQELARRKAQTEQQTADVTLHGKQAAADFYANNGGAPGVPVELMQQSDWLKKNPGKGPSDYVAWKAKQAPLAQFNMMNNTGVGQPPANIAKQFGMTPESFDQAAERFQTTGTLPPSGRGGPALAKNQAIMNRAAELHPGESLAANSAEYKANADSLKKLQSFSDSVQAFEQTAQKNIGLLRTAAANIPDLGSRWANVPVRMLNSNMIGTVNMAKFRTALNTAQTESAKVLNNPNSSAVLSDSARKDLQGIVDESMTFPAMMASLDTLQQDMTNRSESNRQQIETIQQRLRGAGGSTPSANTGQSGAAPSGADVQVKGSDGKMYWGNSKTKQVLGPVQ